MIVRKIILTLSAMMLLSTTAFAESLQVEYTRDLKNESIIVNVMAKPEDIVSIQALTTNISPEIIQERADKITTGIVSFAADEKVKWFHTDVIDSTGKVSYTISPDGFGDYGIYVTSKNTDDIVSTVIPYCTTAEYEMIVDMFKDAADDGMASLPGGDTQIAYSELVSGYGKYLGLESVDIYSEDAAERFRTEFAEGLSKDDYEENKDKFIKCAIIEGLNANTLTDASAYIEDAFGTDTTLIGYMDKHITSTEIKEYFTKKLGMTEITDSADLLKKARQAMVLTVAQYPNGNTNLQAVMNSYKEELGLTSVSSNTGVYTDIAGEDYADISALLEAYNDAGGNSTSEGSSSSSSSSSGPSNSDRYTSSTGVGSIAAGSSSAGESSSALGIMFEDLDSVAWAYEHISKLYAEGIISGVTKTEFSPNDQVLREQLATMLVRASGLENSQAGNAGFVDVVNGSWYEVFVNIAKANGIVTGVSESEFGVGYNITRQDMATMIYRAMLKNGYVSKGAVNNFADKDMCAAYANEAIAELSTLGIINGVGDNRFGPTGSATRAQAAVMINRALPYLR